MKKVNKSSSLLDKASPKAIGNLAKKSFSGSGGSNNQVFQYLLSLSDVERNNGLTAKQIAIGCSKEYGCAMLDSKVRGFFRTYFQVGKVKADNPNPERKIGKGLGYVDYNETIINGEMWIAHATQVGTMVYTLMNSVDEFNALGR